ncbi:hypothetical protein [Amycolatopsis pigmentata]|uniref:Uncharacterized protein n=1 Tax=Amycolatopsis pigmentata TaxID=450801 RepID=A0ABW5FKJ7_9PSEU
MASSPATTTSATSTPPKTSPGSLSTSHRPPEKTRLDELGTATLDVPTGAVIISEITKGAHGPFTLPNGPGVYQLRILGTETTRHGTADRVAAIVADNPTTAAITTALETVHGREQYWIDLHRTGESPGEDE